jgi:hypothetical protein
MNGCAMGVDAKTNSFIPDLWLPMRDDSFDSGLVEGGPMPLPLSDGNYLYLYNSARHGFPSPDPGYDFQYVSSLRVPVSHRMGLTVDLEIVSGKIQYWCRNFGRQRSKQDLTTNQSTHFITRITMGESRFNCQCGIC